MQTFAIGVDLGGTNLRVAAVREDGVQLDTMTMPTGVSRGPDGVMEQIALAIQTIVSRLPRNPGVTGIGVGVPGLVDVEGGFVRTASNLPGWNDYPVRQRLESLLRMSVVLENDANCAALGESWLGAGRGMEDLCMLTLGTGVGGGLVVRGEPWRGMAGMAGELGHISVFPEGSICACGNRGCLELYASATAIRRMALEVIAEGKSSRLAAAADLEPQFDAKTVFECATAGDIPSRNIFETVGTALGIALANMINAFNLPVYVIGGGVAEAWPAFSPALFRELGKRSIVFRAGARGNSKKNTTVVTQALLKDHAGLLGAARLPMLLAERRGLGSAC